MLRLIGLFLIVWSLISCTATKAVQPSPKMVWQIPPNGSEAQFKRDLYECKRENMQPGEYRSGPYGDLWQSSPAPYGPMVRECMNLRGYRWVPASQ